jgi:hypothetical protein
MLQFPIDDPSFLHRVAKNAGSNAAHSSDGQQSIVIKPLLAGGTPIRMKERARPPPRISQVPMRLRHLLLILCLAGALILVLRRPDAILNPQFWAEDGKVWFANAYNLGPLRSLLLPQDGYFQTISRITAAISLLVPTKSAPLVFNLVALIIQLLPFGIIVSPRFAGVIPELESD